MKHNYLRNLFTALLLLCCTTLSAHDFEVDGIYYNILSEEDKTVEVTHREDDYFNEDYSNDIVIPANVTYNGTTYSVTTIGNDAFYNCFELTSITIPNSIKTIGKSAFYGCEALDYVYISDLSAWCNIDFYSTRGIGGLAPGEFLFCNSNPLYYAKNLYLNGKILTDIVIPNNITIIKDAAFYGYKSLKSVSMHNNVTSIGISAFMNCNELVNITISNSVITIGKHAFCGCKLKSITIPSSVTNIGDFVFSNNSLTSITSLIPAEKLSAIWLYDSFYGVNKSVCTLYVPAGAKETYAATEGWNEFKNILELTDENRQCGDNAHWDFEEATGTLIITGEGPMYDFSDNTAPWYKHNEAINNVIINDGITTIGNSAFKNCNYLTNITIGNSVTTIGDDAFNGCFELTSITIPNSVTTIGNSAFISCESLTSITSLIPAKKLSDVILSYGTFDRVDKKKCTLYVPIGAKETYAATRYWNEFNNIVEIEPTEVTITINQYGSATYCSPYTLDFSNVQGLKAYAATGYKSSTKVVTLIRVQTAGAGVGLFLKGEPGEYVVPIIESTDEHSLNMLVGTLEPTTVNSTDGGMTNFKYTIKSGDETPLFYQFEDNSTLSAGKAYLQIPTAWLPATAQKSVNICFDDGETTDIDEVEDENGESKTIYDLQGRIVKNPTSGIYIINGRKVFIK